MSPVVLLIIGNEAQKVVKFFIYFSNVIRILMPSRDRHPPTNPITSKKHIDCRLCKGGFHGS